MRRERESLYTHHRFGLPAGDKPYFYHRRRILQVTADDRDSRLPVHISIPSLSRLKTIKDRKIRHLKALIRSGRYDTSERQRETAKRIVDFLLAEIE